MKGAASRRGGKQRGTCEVQIRCQGAGAESLAAPLADSATGQWGLRLTCRACATAVADKTRIQGAD